MGLIYIKERLENDDSVTIQVDGILDSESVPILKDVFERQRMKGRKVLLLLNGLTHISREGKQFLKELSEKKI
jgi:anti-anti-sigma regulatory factor